LALTFSSPESRREDLGGFARSLVRSRLPAIGIEVDLASGGTVANCPQQEPTSGWRGQKLAHEIDLPLAQQAYPGVARSGPYKSRGIGDDEIDGTPLPAKGFF
jgi:hypothetical protein